jgi:hypothetical protein
MQQVRDAFTQQVRQLLMAADGWIFTSTVSFGFVGPAPFADRCAQGAATGRRDAPSAGEHWSIPVDEPRNLASCRGLRLDVATVVTVIAAAITVGWDLVAIGATHVWLTRLDGYRATGKCQDQEGGLYGYREHP